MIFGALLLVLLISVAGCRAAQDTTPTDRQVQQQPGDYERSLMIDGRNRSYTVHLPSGYTGEHPLPLVVVLHGGGGNAQNAIQMTGMSAKADKEGFIVVYPNGTGRLKDRLLTWNAGFCCGYALDQQVDDVGFIRTLIENLQQQYDIDSKKVYATGISNGAMMAYRLACELSDKIAAIAAVSGSLDTERCQVANPLSVIVFHGTADMHILYDGGKPKQQLDNHPRVDPPVSHTVAFWVKHGSCSTTPLQEKTGQIIRDTYTNCRDNTGVILYTIQGGGHAWPGGAKGSAWGDEPTQEISATDLMWDFFAQHPK